MSYPHDRPTNEPGGMECYECGAVFVGSAAHDQCAVCANNGWFPIDTAPLGGELMLLSCAAWPLPNIPVKVGGYWDDKWNIFGASWRPTHWKPLPKPPAALSQDTHSPSPLNPPADEEGAAANSQEQKP